MTSEDAIDLLNDNFTVINTHGHYTDEEVEQLRNGVEIEDYTTKPAEVRILKTDISSLSM